MFAVQVMVDFHACRWPAELNAMDTSLAEHFDAMNTAAVAQVAEALDRAEQQQHARPPVITFSHYLPVQVSCYWLVR